MRSDSRSAPPAKPKSSSAHHVVPVHVTQLLDRFELLAFGNWGLNERGTGQGLPGE